MVVGGLLSGAPVSSGNPSTRHGIRAGRLPRLMAGRIVVFGATGYSGRLVAERLVAAGERPVLAGRSEARLSELAAALGGLKVARADALRTNTVFSLVGP